MRVIFLTLILCLSLAVSQGSHAVCAKNSDNVLFFAFNDAKEEVESARQVAADKCQNFIVVKSEDAANSALKKINDSGESISSMILSGHHKWGMFWGGNFHMTIGSVDDLMSKYPAIKGKVQNMYLWGCYTNNLDKLDRWLKSFPQLKYVFGYNQKSPLSEQLTGVEYLKNAMTMQDELAKQDSLDKVKTFLDTKLIPGNSPNFQFVSAAIYGVSRCQQAHY